MFKNQPKGLYALALANTGERFGYYTMLAVFALFLRANFGLDAGVAGAIYSTFLGLVYFMPLVGGIMADKFGFGKMVTIGITIMFAGYLLLSLPLGSDTIAMILYAFGVGIHQYRYGSFQRELTGDGRQSLRRPQICLEKRCRIFYFLYGDQCGSAFCPYGCGGN